MENVMSKRSEYGDADEDKMEVFIVFVQFFLCFYLCMCMLCNLKRLKLVLRCTVTDCEKRNTYKYKNEHYYGGINPVMFIEEDTQTFHTIHFYCYVRNNAVATRLSKRSLQTKPSVRIVNSKVEGAHVWRLASSRMNGENDSTLDDFSENLNWKPLICIDISY